MGYTEKQAAERYDAWFEKNPHLFDSEIEAIRQLMPDFERGIEVGVGTGLFASRLGLPDGVEPSKAMGEKASERGIKVIYSRAEDMPVAGGSYSVVLMVTAVCFLDDVHQAFAEVHRILVKGGSFILAFIDKDTELGDSYLSSKGADSYYRNARFYTVRKASELLTGAGFKVVDSRQTIFNFEDEPQPVLPGTGRGAFAVLRAEKL